MNIAKFSINRPIFVTCLVATMILFGAISLNRLGLDLMPNMDFPVVMISTTYSGAAPEEVANQISKPLEDQLSALAGVKHISSTNTEGRSVISVEYEMDTDIDKASQDIRDKVSIAKVALPDDADDPVVQKMDPDSMPILKLVLLGDLAPEAMYDLADEKIKPQLSKVDGIGSVDIIGGTKREIQLELDKQKLDEYDISMTALANSLANAGSNVPVGSKEEGSTRTVFRAMGEFRSLDQIENTVVSFSGDVGHSVSVKNLGNVRDGTEDVSTLGYLYFPSAYKGTDTIAAKASLEKNKTIPCVYLTVNKQSGVNTVKVADDIKSKIEQINATIKGEAGNPHLALVLDTTNWIRTNVNEAESSILLGIILAIFVVYLFLGNIRSTIITAIAIPNSLFGAFIIMYLNGFTLNLMTLMALSLTVGLLVDDAIVVRENIFRKLEAGMSPRNAAILGSREVTLAVIATTLTIMAVFIPIGLIEGIIGSFLKQFGLTVVFAMAISLFDALTVAPLLSAYFAGKGEKRNNAVVRAVDRFQNRTDSLYEKIMNFCLGKPLVIIGITLIIFLSSIVLIGFVNKSLIPSGGDQGQFAINITMPAGTSLQGTKETVQKIEEKIRTLEDLKYYMVTVGSSTDDPAEAEIDIFLSPERKKDTDANMKLVRSYLTEFSYASPMLASLTGTSAHTMHPFQMVVSGHDLTQVEATAEKIITETKKVSDLTDVDSTMKKGNPEMRIVLDPEKMQRLGVSPTTAGRELRYCVAGITPATYRVGGLEYNIRARLKPEQRDLRYTYNSVRVPNVSGSMVALSSVSSKQQTIGSAAIYRQDKSFIVKISASLSPNGGVGTAMEKVNSLVKKNVTIPNGVSAGYSGQSEEFTKTISSAAFALLLAIAFIYMILASLYESFITPFTILLAIPPAMTGALFSLFITGKPLDINSIIGMLLLMGLVTKNSILLVDFAREGVKSGMTRKNAILEAGKKRLRPILMTTFAMLAGTAPLAFGMGEAAAMRQGMGIAIVGGLIVSTVITLVVVPAVFEYVDRLREFIEAPFRMKEEDEEKPKKRKLSLTRK